MKIKLLKYLDKKLAQLYQNLTKLLKSQQSANLEPQKNCSFPKNSYL